MIEMLFQAVHLENSADPDLQDNAVPSTECPRSFSEHSNERAKFFDSSPRCDAVTTSAPNFTWTAQPAPLRNLFEDDESELALPEESDVNGEESSL